jgi:hypothetical protein
LLIVFGVAEATKEMAFVNPFLPMGYPCLSTHPEVAGAVDVAIFLLRGSWVTSRWSFKPWLMSICAG